MSASNASSISLILNQQISYAVYHLPAGTYSLPDDSGKLSQELLISLGLIERTSAPPTVPPPPPPPPSSADTDDADTKSDSKETKARTRTVSKKMKDAFLASPGKTEDDLKRVSKAYKAATDADIAAAGGDFVSFGNRILAAPATPAASAAPPVPKEDKTKTKTVKPKVEKPKPRLAWSAAEKKVFKDIVTDVTDDLKAEFAAYIDAKSDDDFKAFAMAGHMRAWFDARVTITPKAGNGEFTPAEYDLARGVQNSGVQDDDEDADDEDLVDIDVDGEQLLIGTKTGTIYQPTEEAGDVKIGRAGEGKFKHVKIPQE
jgi:hypothetical protein